MTWSLESDVSVLDLVERARDGADDVEADRLPDSDGCVIGLHDRVELDNSTTVSAGPVEL